MAIKWQKMKKIIFFLFLFPTFIQAQTTLDEIITDISLPHEGRPHGVPLSYNWSQKPRVGAQQPPAGWNSAIAWGQLYEWTGGNPATNTRVQIKNLAMYYLSKADRKWHLLQKSVGVDGAAYVEDFAGDVNKPADKRLENDGSVSVKAGGGYNFHFWPKQGRVKYPENDVAGCYVTVQARLVLDNASGIDDRASAKYVMSVGGDWWQSLTAVWDQWKTNADMGIGRFRFVTPEWKSFNMITAPVDTVRKNPPPYLAVTISGIQSPLSKPEKYLFQQNYPNPFFGATTIKFSLMEQNQTKLYLLNASGQIIKTLIDKPLPAGEYSVSLNSSDLPSGEYFIRLEGKDFSETKICNIIK